MKNVIFVIIIFVFSSFSFSQKNDNNLVAYYPFNGNTNDESGNNNHGYVRNAILTKDKNEKMNSAYYFNGINSYIEIPNSNSLSSLSKSLTFCAWVYVNDWYNNIWAPIVCKSNNSSFGMFTIQLLNLKNERKFPNYVKEFEVLFNSNYLSVSYFFELKKWYHISISWDGYILKYYVNGVLIEKKLLEGSIQNDNNPLIFGKDSPEAVEYFNGKLDEICIYNSCLTDNEISLIYQGNYFIDNNENIQINFLNNYNTIAYFPFENNVTNYINQSDIFTIYGNCKFLNGKINNAIYLDGDGDYVDLGRGFNLGKEFSLCFWIKPDELTRKYATIFAKYETNKYGPFAFSLNYNNLNLWFSDGKGSYKEINSKSEIKENVWTFVVYTIFNNEIEIYINNILDSKINYLKNDNNENSLITESNDRVTIGRQALMFEPYRDLQYKGHVDELLITNFVLNYEQRKLLFNNSNYMIFNLNPYKNKLNDAQNAYAEGNYILVLEILKDFGTDDPLYSEAIELIKLTIAKLQGDKTQKYVTVSGNVNCRCNKAISGYLVFEDLNKKQYVGKCKILSNGYYCIILPTGCVFSYYIESKDFYPVSRIIDFTQPEQSPNHIDNFNIVSYEEMKEQQVSIRINNIFFNFNESKLKSESFLELDRLYKFLTENSEISVEISGHTDNIGTDEYNLNLSHARANAVKEYLVSKGINANRIISKGYGESNPTSTNDTDEGRQLNRRVEFKILK